MSQHFSFRNRRLVQLLESLAEQAENEARAKCPRLAERKCGSRIRFSKSHSGICHRAGCVGKGFEDPNPPRNGEGDHPQDGGGGSPRAQRLTENPLRQALRGRHLPFPGRIVRTSENHWPLYPPWREATGRWRARGATEGRVRQELSAGAIRERHAHKTTDSSQSSSAPGPSPILRTVPLPTAVRQGGCQSSGRVKYSPRAV